MADYSAAFTLENLNTKGFAFLDVSKWLKYILKILNTNKLCAKVVEKEKK